MPFLSKSQQRWAHTPAGIKALGGLSKVSEWNAETKGKNIPEKKKKVMIRVKKKQ